MPPLDPRSPSVVKFLTENYEKENFRRFAWAQKNQNKLIECAKFKKEPKNYCDTDVRAHIMKNGMTALTKDFISSGRNRFHERPNDGEIKGIESIRHGHSIVDVKLGDPIEDPRLDCKEGDLCIEPVMRPVDPALTKQLYQMEPTRKEYLKKRYLTKPEDRFYFAECSSWAYGWRLQESKNLRKPMHPRYAMLMRALANRVGPTPDPPHYQSSKPGGYCS